MIVTPPIEYYHSIRKPNSFLNQYLAMVKKEFKIQMRYPVALFSSFFMMFVIILTFTVVATLFLDSSNNSGGVNANNISTFMFWGFLFFNFLQDMLRSIGQSFRQEQQTGTLESLFLFPLDHLANLLAKITWVAFLNVFVGIFAFFVFTNLTGEILFNQFFLSIFIFVLYLSQIVGIAFIFAGISIRLRESIEPIIGLFQFSLIIICSFFFPFTVLGPIIFVSILFPISFTIDTLRSVVNEAPVEIATILNNYFAIDITYLVYLEYLYVLATAILLPLLGYKFFLKQINDGRKSGNLSDY